MRRRYSLITILIIGIPLFAQAQVSITEIAWMGTTESQFGEWIEFYNSTDAEVSLKNWKLYEAGGDTLIFNFSKSIAPKSYLVLERTTGSSPDPLPEVQDEAGTFGGSGLSNSGEYLVLKDDTNQIVQSLDFSKGWPAGDSESKQTMQLDGTTWITAPATLKEGTSGGTLGGEASKPLENAPSGKAYVPPVFEPRIDLAVPSTIYANISNEYSATTYMEYGQVYNGVFFWNMGDGTTYQTKTPLPIRHTYRYPGVYTISFGFYRTPYDKKPVQMTSVTRTVSDPKVTLSIVSEKGVQITNSDTVPLDISQWRVVFESGGTGELPPLSIIGAKSSVIIPFDTLSIQDIPPTVSAVLKSPEGISIASSEKDLSIFPKKTQKNEVRAIIKKNTTEISSPLSASIEESYNTSPKQSQQKNYTKAIFFGVALLVVIGLFLLLERFMAKGE